MGDGVIWVTKDAAANVIPVPIPFQVDSLVRSPTPRALTAQTFCPNVTFPDLAYALDENRFVSIRQGKLNRPALHHRDPGAAMERRAARR